MRGPSGDTRAKLLEYQSKRILRDHGIVVPAGEIASDPREAEAIARKLGGNVVVKAQLPFTGRYDVGGVRFASSPEEVRVAAEEMLSSYFKGFRPKKVLVEKKVDVKAELFLSVVINDSRRFRSPMLLASPSGGTGVEERSEGVVRIPVDYLDGLRREVVEEEFSRVGIPSEAVDVALKLYDIFVEYDARSVEVNPLALTDEGLVALDARMDLDDHALFRHPEVKVEIPKDLNREPTDLERRIWYWDDADPRGTGYYIQLTTQVSEGYVGFHGIGGGGAMLAADALIRKGLKLANYADTSGDPPASKVYRVIRTILSIPGIEGYVMMGSVLASQEQWHHAHAIVKAFNEMLRDRPGFPAVILLAGNKEEESHEIIRRGVKDLPIRFELYGRDYIYETEYIADRVLKLVEEYRRERGREHEVQN